MRYKRVMLCLLICAGILGMLCGPVSASDAPGDGTPAEYAALYPVPEGSWQSAPEKFASEAADTLLKGRSILFIGDSLTTGYGLEDPAQSWASMLGSGYGMKVTNCSVNGSTFVRTELDGYVPGGSYRPYVDRELPDGAFDVVFVEGGGNDWYCAAPLGDDPESRDPGTFQGAVNVVIDCVQEKYPNALLVFMTSWIPKEEEMSADTLEMDYYEAMSRICAQREIPCFQARDPEVSGIYAADPEFRKTYFLTEDDAWHLNAAGQAKFLPTIAGWLEQQVREQIFVGGFYDVGRDGWFAEPIQYVYDHKLMNGMAEHSFGPDLPMTRGMLVTVLYRAAGSPAVEDAENPFVDVPDTAYYWDAVRWGYQNGIINGIDPQHFAPEELLTRQQMMAVFYRQACSAGTAEPGGEENADVLLPFRDSDTITPYAVPSMIWGVEHGIIRGMEADVLGPMGNTSRAQVATVLQRYIEEFLPDVGNR